VKIKIKTAKPNMNPIHGDKTKKKHGKDTQKGNLRLGLKPAEQAVGKPS